VPTLRTVGELIVHKWPIGDCSARGRVLSAFMAGTHGAGVGRGGAEAAARREVPYAHGLGEEADTHREGMRVMMTVVMPLLLLLRMMKE
jgi:hypothetical protein